MSVVWDLPETTGSSSGDSPLPRSDAEIEELMMALNAVDNGQKPPTVLELCCEARMQWNFEEVEAFARDSSMGGT